MSGLALSSLLLIALLVPGFVFHFRYYQTVAQSWNETGTVDTTFARAIVFSLAFALPSHTLWIWIVEQMHQHWETPSINFGVLIALLQGDPISDASIKDSLASQLRGSLPWLFTAYFISQLFAAFLAGPLLARLLEVMGWAKSVALSSPAGIWHRLLIHMSDEKYGFDDLKGNPPDGVIVSVTITHGDRTFLYYGILFDYWIDPTTRRLERLLLRFVVKKEMSDQSDNATKRVRGEYFMVECRTVETIDIDYFWMAEESDVSDTAPAEEGD